MRSVRDRVLQRFPLEPRMRVPDEDVADALYALLWSIDDLDVNPDGWAYFRVIRESADSLDAVGLMTLLPSGSIPIAIGIESREAGFVWSVKVAWTDPSWFALSESKRWNSVYLYATGERETPQWTWCRQHHGSVHLADA